MDAPTVVVLGGSSGIGLAAARLLLAQGHDVLVTGRDAARLEAARGHGLRTAAFDVADGASLRAALAAAAPVDHLVLALSGAKGAGPFATLDLADLREGFDTKFWLHLAAAQAVLPHLRTDGSITFVTAVSARMHAPGTAGLAAINGALEAMVPVLARELAPVRVNAVSPGVIDTPWWDALGAEAKAQVFAHYGAAAPVGRVGRPEEVAAAIALLVQNAFMTGTVLEVDGGLRLA